MTFRRFIRDLVENYRILCKKCVICGKPRSDVYCSLNCILKDPETTPRERNALMEVDRCRQESKV